VRQDVSPRGGKPGFVHVADEKTLLLPDRGGNNRLDNIRNRLSGSGQIGMMFLIAGRTRRAKHRSLIQRPGSPPTAVSLEDLSAISSEHVVSSRRAPRAARKATSTSPRDERAASRSTIMRNLLDVAVTRVAP
jgi:hypothetical protein